MTFYIEPEWARDLNHNLFAVGWAIVWCLYCQEGWTCVAMVEQAVDLEEMLELLCDARSDHESECSERPPLTSTPEEIQRWLSM